MNAFAPAPPAAVSRVLATFSRDELAAFVTVAIDLLDLAGGNPDVEANGDELDGTNAEDEECGFGSDGPGCPCSDTDFGAEEAGEPEMGVEHPAYATDQSQGPLSPYAH